MRARAAGAAALAACLLGLVACGGDAGRLEPPPPRQEPEGTGYFVGRAAPGLGAAVDLAGTDPVARAVARALDGGPPGRAGAPVVAIASLVNDADVPLPRPRMAALLPGGGATPMTPALRALRGVPGPAARRARALLAADRGPVPAGGAALEYLVLRGTGALEVEGLRMRVPPGEPVELSSRGR